MSKTLLTVLLAELELVRIRCPKCDTVIEMAIGDAAARFQETRCPVCKEGWGGLASPKDDDYLTRLLKAIQSLQAVGGAPELEFVLAAQPDGRK